MLINLIGYTLLFSIIKTIHHHQIEEFLSEKTSLKKQEQLQFSHDGFNQLHWRRHGKEFEYKNNLYDIVRVVSTVNGVTIVCYKDTHEKKLESFQANQLSNETYQLAIQLNLQYLLDDDPFTIEEVRLILHSLPKNFFTYTEPFSIPHLSVDSPPPNHPLMMG